MEDKIRQAEDFIETGQYTKAIGILNSSLEEDRSTAALYMRGYTYFCMGNAEPARADLEEVLQRESGHAEACYYLAQLLLTGNEPEKAKEYMEKALSIDPENEDYLCSCIGVEQALRNFDRVIDLARMLLDINPVSNFGQNALGTAYLRMGEADKAVKCFKAAVDEDPIDFLGWNNLGMAYAALEKIEDAGKAVQKALSLNSAFPDGYSQLGYLVHRKGNHQKALEFIDYALEMDPNNADAWKKRAQVYLVLGEKEKAREDLLKSSELGYEKYFDNEVNELLESLG